MTAVADAPAGTDRTPPHDLTAEQSVLGGMMLSKDAIADVVEILRSADLYRPNHSTVFDTILDLYGRGEPADPITVGNELAKDPQRFQRIGGASYLHDLIQTVPTAANAGYYARIVREKAILRRLIEAGTRVVQLGHNAAGAAGRDVDDVVDLAQQAVYDVGNDRRDGDGFEALARLMQPTLDEIEAAGATAGAMRGIPTGFADLDRLLNGLQSGQLIVFAGRPGIGKALALDTPLPTPDGWTTMGKVRIGSTLLDAQGRPTTVTATSPVMVGRDCYEVCFSDGTTIVADGEHRWLTHTRANRRIGAAPEVRTTAEIAATLRCNSADRRLNHSISTCEPLALPTANLPIAPYTLGVWLGDGHSAGCRYTSNDPEVAMHIEAEGYEVERQTGLTYSIRLAPPARDGYCADCAKPTARDYHGSGDWLARCLACARQTGSFGRLLRAVGVLDNKHIPRIYLRSSIEQRRALLAGLLDTDGTVTPRGVVQYASTSRRLAEEVGELVTSLGYRCSTMTKPVRGRSANTSTAYIINFSTGDEVFRLERKRLTHKDRCRTQSRTRSGLRFITAVRSVPSVPVRCVSVDNPEHLYLAGRSMIPTHNSTGASDVARNASIKLNLATAIFNMEMSKVELMLRILSAEARVSLNTLRSGQLSDDDWTKLARRMGEISEAPLFIDDTPNMTLMEIRAKARRLKQQHDLKLIVVDYLGLMTPLRRSNSRQEDVAEMSRGLKLLAKEIEVPVIAVHQLNRNPEGRQDKRPQLSDLRDSGAVEQDADIVILVHRDDYYDKESPRAGEADFIVAKHRNGPTDTITVAAQLHLSRFVDMALG